MQHKLSWRVLASLAAAAALAAGCQGPVDGDRATKSPSPELTRQDLRQTPSPPAPTTTAEVATPVPTVGASASPSPVATDLRPPAGLTAPEARTLASLRKVDTYPLYTMEFEGGYALPVDASLVSGTRSAGGAYTGRTSTVLSWGCSLFAAMGGRGTVYGRNFDWQMSPALLLYTKPPDGFASVSIVDLAYLLPEGDTIDAADLPLGERAALLDAPYWPFDGMNEHGLVVGMAAVPESPLPQDPERPDIGSLMAIRLMLDLARDVDEAVGILRSYDVLWHGGPALHYLVADVSGRAALVEYVDGQMVVLASEDPWQVATNHLRTNRAAGQPSGCWRYDTLAASLSAANGVVGPAEAMDLLQVVSQSNTQWSVVYDTEQSQVQIVMGRRFESAKTFSLLGQLARSSDGSPSH